MFTSFKSVDSGEKLFIGNSAMSEIHGQGKVILKMTSRKNLTPKNVLYVLEIHKNLVFDSLLDKHGFKMVFNADNVVVSKSRLFVGKGYVSNGLFKLNVMIVKPKIMSKTNVFFFLCA